MNSLVDDNMIFKYAFTKMINAMLFQKTELYIKTKHIWNKNILYKHVARI